MLSEKFSLEIHDFAGGVFAWGGVRSGAGCVD